MVAVMLQAIFLTKEITSISAATLRHDNRLPPGLIQII